MYTDKLYKRTATGAIQVWWQDVIGNKYRTCSGQLDGVITKSGWTVCDGKNIGKKNETSPEEQAQKEVEANYKKKLTQGGYSETIEGVDQDTYTKPMLAQKYEDHTIKFPVFAQPKLDGIRCIANSKGLWSRQGKPITSCPHVWNAVHPFVNQGFEFDGELYLHTLKDDFNSIVSAVRKDKPTKESAKIEYHVYDLVDRRKHFSARIQLLNSLLLQPPIKYVPTYKCGDQEELDELFASFIADGYEGQMIRLDKEYEHKRSKNLLKRKEFQDAECTILEICEGIGNRANMAGYVRCSLNGVEFKAGIKGGEDLYVKLLDNKELYKGGQATVRYFHLTPAGVPRFPVAVAFYPTKRDL